MDGSPWHIGIIDDYWWLLGCGDGWSLKIRELKSIWESKQEHMGMGLSLRPWIDWKFVRHFLANLWINAMNKEGIHWLIRSIISKLAISIHFGVVINPHRGYIWYGDRSQGHCKEFYLRRPFMLCWEPSRKFFCEFAKDFFLFAKVGYYESWLLYTLQLVKFVKGLRATTSFRPGVRQENGSAHLPFPS